MKEKKIEVIFSNLKKIDNFDCESTSSCNLISSLFLVEDYIVHLSDGNKNYGTKLTAKYKTSNIDDLEEYGFVSFIRGCQFESKMKDDIVLKSMSRARYFFDKIVPYHHPQWVIDSVDSDPFYNSNKEYSIRHFLYRWNRIPNSFNNSTSVFYGSEKPETPHLYVFQMPGTAFYLEEGQNALNISLLFKICLYKNKDVPFQTYPENIFFARPISCHDWKSSFIYNHDVNKFEMRQDLDPFCR